MKNFNTGCALVCILSPSATCNPGNGCCRGPCSMWQPVLPGLPPAPGCCFTLCCRHLDRNGDGYLSVQEMEELLLELGIGGEDAQRAATGLLRAAGSGEGQGVSVASFLQFYRQVGGTPSCCIAGHVLAADSSVASCCRSHHEVGGKHSCRGTLLCIAGSMEGRGVPWSCPCSGQRFAFLKGGTPVRLNSTDRGGGFCHFSSHCLENNRVFEVQGEDGRSPGGLAAGPAGWAPMSWLVTACAHAAATRCTDSAKLHGKRRAGSCLH